MRVIKYLMVAVLLTWLITHFLGDITSNVMFNVSNSVKYTWQQYSFNVHVGSLGEILLSILAILLVFVLLVGVFGASLILFGIIIGIVCVALVSSFWPVLLIALVVYVLSSNNSSNKSNNQFNS